MVIASEVVKELDRFRGDIDAVFNIRESKLSESREEPSVEIGVSVAFRSALSFHERIIQFDLENRQKCWNGEIDANEFEKLDAALGYFSNIWHAYAKQFLSISDARAVKDERLERLRCMVSEMEAVLRSRETPELTMSSELQTLQASAIEEHRRGETEAFL